YGVTGLSDLGVLDYSTEAMKSTTVDPSHTERIWWWQKCTQLAYFQTAPALNSLRSQHVSLEGHYRRCSEVYDLDISLYHDGVLPATYDNTITYGAAQYGGTQVMFVSGGDDPWTEACNMEENDLDDGVYMLVGTDEPSHTVPCYQAGHAVDLVTPTDEDCFDLMLTRDFETDLINAWMEL
ncbi:peptidase S28, partial [Kipferlia bialata]